MDDNIELKYSIDQQYRNDPKMRMDLLSQIDDDEGVEYYVGGYKEVSFDVDPRELVNKLSEKKGYGRVVDEMLGGNGTAYFTTKGNVIKLTGDRSEYETSNTLKGKKNKYIANVYETGKLKSSHIVQGEVFIVIMEELGLPKGLQNTFEGCCCGVSKPIHIEFNENPVIIHPPIGDDKECRKIYNNLIRIKKELGSHGIIWNDIGIDNLGVKDGHLALLDMGETTGGFDNGTTIEMNETVNIKRVDEQQMEMFETGEWRHFSEMSGSDIEVVESVGEETVKFLFKEWDSVGFNVELLRLMSLPTKSYLFVSLLKRWLFTTKSKVPVSFRFDEYDLVKMFNGDYEFIEFFMSGNPPLEGWHFDSEWDDDDLDLINDKNLTIISKVIKCPIESVYNILSDNAQNELEDNIIMEEDVIHDIKLDIRLSKQLSNEYSTERELESDIITALSDHFDHGRMERTSSGKINWVIEGDLLNWVRNADMWNKNDYFKHNPDYWGDTLEGILIQYNPLYITPDLIFQILLTEEYTFEEEDGQYGKRGDLLEVNSKIFGDWYPDIDKTEFNEILLDRISYYEEHQPITEAGDIFGQGMLEPIEYGTYDNDKEWEEDVENVGDFDDGGQPTTNPQKGVVIPSQSAEKNICTVESFCEEQGPITFGQLKALVNAATNKRIGSDVARGGFKTIWRLAPFFLPQLLLVSAGLTVSRALNKIIKPSLTDTTGYQSWWGKVIMRAMDVAEGDYIPDKALGDDPLEKVFFISDGLMNMIKDKYKLKFARYVSDVANSKPDNEPVKDWFVENLLRDYLNKKFLLDPPLQPKRGIEFDELMESNIYDLPKEGEQTVEGRKDEIRELLNVIWDDHGVTLDSSVIGMYGLDVKMGQTTLVASNELAIERMGGLSNVLDTFRESIKGEHKINLGGGGSDISIGGLVINSVDDRIVHLGGVIDGDGVFRAFVSHDWVEFPLHLMNSDEGMMRQIDMLSDAGILEWESITQIEELNYELLTELLNFSLYDYLKLLPGGMLLDIELPHNEFIISDSGGFKGESQQTVNIMKTNQLSEMFQHPDVNPDVEAGDVIELLYMDDIYGLPVGTIGVVIDIYEELGQKKINVKWRGVFERDGKLYDNTLALLPDIDVYRFPKPEGKHDRGVDDIIDDVIDEHVQHKTSYKTPHAIINGEQIHLDVANTEFLKQKGMMNKTSYPEDRGMLFMWDEITPISMWMKNTLLSLDIVYMVDGEVVDYDKDVQPCEEEQCDSYGNVNANQVIELLSGGIDRYNIKMGDHIEINDL